MSAIPKVTIKDAMPFWVKPPATMPEDELDALAHSLGFESACSIIQSNCVQHEVEEFSGDSDPSEWGLWFDLDGASSTVPQETLVDCVRYLEARGLLDRHPKHPNWVDILDESEATR